MAQRDGPISRASRTARDDQDRVRAEIDRARRSAGLSLADVGRACSMSRMMVKRILDGVRPATPIELAVLGAAVGLEIRVRAYPAGDPIRDAGQQRLLARLRAVVPETVRIRTEVPLPVAGDRRAWDAVLSGRTWRAAVEAETVLDDIQAVERRLALKARDGDIAVVLLIVAATPRNRRALRAAPLAFSGFSRDSRTTLAALRRGDEPHESALILL